MSNSDRDKAERFVFLLSSLIDAKIDKDKPFNIQMIETSLIDTILLKPDGSVVDKTLFDDSAPVSPDRPQNLTCPLCGKGMKPRSSQHGKFFGCIGYPDCKGTRDENGMSKDEREKEKEGIKPKGNRKWYVK